MPLRHVAKHIELAMTALNTFKVEKKDLGLGAAKKAVIEDVAIELSSPDLVATTLTAVYGGLAVGNQETIITSNTMSQPGMIVGDKNVIVCDATPLPVVYNCQSPVYREGPFPLVKDPDGNWYVTACISSVACTALKSVKARVDITVED